MSHSSYQNYRIQNPIYTACFLYLSKVFDLDNHALLLFTIAMYSLLHNALDLFKSCIKSRDLNQLYIWTILPLWEVEALVPKVSVRGPKLV